MQFISLLKCKCLAIYGVWFPGPLDWSILQVAGCVVEAMELEGELRADLLQSSPFPAVIKHVSVATDKDKVALIVEGHGLATFELGGVREEGHEKASNSVSQASGKVVQDELWSVSTGTTMVVDLFVQLQGSKLEDSSGALGKLHNTKAVRDLPGLVDNHQVTEILLDRHLNDILKDMMAFATMKFGARKEIRQFISKHKSFVTSTTGRSDQDFWWDSLDEKTRECIRLVFQSQLYQHL